MHKSEHKLKWLVVRLLQVLAYTFLYVALAQHSEKPAFPDLHDIVKAASTTVYLGLVTHFPSTLIRWFVVFAGGALLGVLSGVVVGYFDTVHSFLKADIDFLRSLPATALVTFVTAALGDGDIVRSFPAFYITFFTMVFYVAKHTRILNHPRHAHLAELGASKWFRIRHCIFYELLPPTMIALRQAVSLSFLVIVSVELIVGSSGNRGLGNLFYNWMYLTDYASIICGLAFLGIVGYSLNVLAAVIHKNAVYWEESKT